MKHQKKPQWLKVRPPLSKRYTEIREMLKDLSLNTVCQEARCPNIEECWGGGTATFMLMGDTCTRACKFCSVKTGNPQGVIDEREPYKVGYAISKMKLDYIVLTSVNRDDLADEGAGHFAETVATIRRENPKMIVEVLAPDFNGREELISILAESGPHVYAHNMETVERLTPTVRDRRATYAQSLQVLGTIKKNYPHIVTKTSLMVGLGETVDEIESCLKDLRQVGVDAITFGQYLAPTSRHIPVVRYVTPEEFELYGKMSDSLGFAYTASGPLVRSSYRAGEFYLKGIIDKKSE